MSTEHILVVDDEADIRSLLQEILSDEGYSVEAAGDAAQARAAVGRAQPDLVLLDIWMPDIDGITLLREWSHEGPPAFPVVVMSGHGTVETAVEATRLGAVEFIEKPLSLAKLLRTVQTALDQGPPRQQLRGRSLLPTTIVPLGRSAEMRALREKSQTLAGQTAPAVIYGEPGTGRETFARYLHDNGLNPEGPFVGVTAAALTPENATAMMLGVETTDGFEPGYIEQSDGGTLFVNELTDLPEEAQRILLALMEGGSIFRPGRTQAVPVKNRVIASTVPESASGESGGARPELMTALGVLELRVPPLRDYSADVPDLLRYYVDLIVETEGLPYRRFSLAAQNRLRNYPWPGNLRELRNLVQRLLTAGGAEEIELEELEAELNAPAGAGEPLVKQDLLSLPLREAREEFERAYLTQQLALCGGKVGQLAKRVGMERTHLYRKLKALGVEFRRTAEE